MTVKKLHGLTQAEQYAVYDVLGRFLAKNWSEVDGDFSDILESLTGFSRKASPNRARSVTGFFYRSANLAMSIMPNCASLR